MSFAANRRLKYDADREIQRPKLSNGHRTDRKYVAWVLRERNLPRSLIKFGNYITKNHGGILQFGKHKHKLFDEVLRDDHNYTLRKH